MLHISQLNMNNIRRHHYTISAGVSAKLCADLLLTHLLQEQYQVATIASLISWQANADAEQYGAAIVMLANRTDINTLHDVVGQTVSLQQPGSSCGSPRLIAPTQDIWIV